MKSYAIIGLGLFGTKLAKDLFDAGYNVLTIDINEKSTEMIADHVTRAVTMDAKNRDALAQLGINKYDCVIVAMSGDLATSVLVTMNLKALNVPKIICKVQNEQDEEVLITLGANFCIIPEHIGASNLAHQLTSKNVLDFTQLSPHHSIMEISVPDEWFGHSIKEINVRVKYGINIIALRRNKQLRVEIDPDSPLMPSDMLFVIGSNKNLNRLQKIL